MRKNIESRSLKVRARNLHPKKSCNICGRSFRAHFSGELFCRTCREASELYRYHDSLAGTA